MGNMTDRNMNDKWWDQSDFQTIGHGSGSELTEWAEHGMFIKALRGGKPVHENSLRGLMSGKLSEIQDIILKEGGRLVYSNPVTGANNPEAYKNEGYGYVIDERMTLSLYKNDETVTITWATFDEELNKKFQGLFKDKILPKISAGRVYTLTKTSDGLDLVSLGKASNELERGNYEDRVLADYDHVISDFKSTDPCGRLVLLNGPPGTGKTYLIKGLLSSVQNALFILVPPNLVGQFSNPEFIPSLLDLKNHQSGKRGPTIMLIEDADDILVPRGGDNMDSISGCLNLTDGIMGHLIDLRIVASTNAKKRTIDDALLRPGRMCKQIEVGHLSNKTALSVFKRLTGRDVEFDQRNYTLAEVYAKARAEGWAPQKAKQEMGFVVENIDKQD